MHDFTFVFTLLSETKAHISVLGAEIDRVSPHELWKQFQQALSAKPEVNLSWSLNLGGSQFGYSSRGIIIITNLTLVSCVGKGIIVNVSISKIYWYVYIPLAYFM